MTRSPHRLVLVVALTAGALSAAAGVRAATAAAAAILADKACYVNTNPSVGAPMMISGVGFIPGDTVAIAGSGVSTTATVGPTGDFVASMKAPILSRPGPGTMRTTLTATDQGNHAVSATTLLQATNLAVSAKPGSVRNVRKDKVTFNFSGFTPGKRIYGYYMRKKVVAKARFGKATGPCGTLHQRALLYPGGHPRSSRYDVTFESTSRYSKTAFPRVTGKLTILHL
ncbi:MAG TPA: hypothetical protein VG365_13955 [Solirubrobacteraceae bacterium]|jgi:hypothetical protein|nr:hypothetical protein [Solirubrobacteraceae bacterium]